MSNAETLATSPTSTVRVPARPAPASQGLFAPINLFEIPIYALRVSDHHEHQQPLVELIRRLRREYPSQGRSNYGGYHSGPEFSDDLDPHVRWVTETATKFARRALAPRYGDWQQVELELGTYWASVLDDGGWTVPHHHAPQAWSCAYYVQVGVEHPPESGNRSGMIEFINPTPGFAAGERSGNFAIAPRDGTIVLFPSQLVHFVHPYHGPIERVVIAHNFNLIPRRALAQRP